MSCRWGLSTPFLLAILVFPCYNNSMPPRPDCYFLLLLVLLSLFPSSAAVEEGVREEWGEFRLILKEPVVSRTVVENGNRLARHRAMEGQTDEAEPPLPSPADCGLELFTVSGSPAPQLRWEDQNRLSIQFAPGSSPNTEYHLEFKPGTTYLGGAALATRSFRFRCKPVELRAQMLPEHAGGVALLSAAHADTAEAQQFAENAAGLRISFRRMRHVPLLGWVCTSSVPAKLEPATVENALSPATRPEVLQALVSRHKPESLRPESVLPQCLLARPLKPLVPGARYELGIEAPAGSGFESGYLTIFNAPGPVELKLSSHLVAQGEVARGGKPGTPPATYLRLSADSPIPEARLHALWEQLSICALNERGEAVAATRQADGSYRLEGEGGVATLRLHRLLPCAGNTGWARHSDSGERYLYTPPGCALGMEIEVDAPRMLVLEFTLPPLLATRHGRGMGEEPLVLRTSVMPACPALTGNGSNELALSGSHLLRLPCINMQGVKATAYHWEAEAAARLLPLIHRGMRDDTVACELLLRLDWLRRRAAEGEDTEGWRSDMRSEAVSALRLLEEERHWQEPLRRRALSQASVYPTAQLSLQPQAGSSGLVQQGEALLDLDQLTCGTLRPGLYLISLTCEPNAEVRQALAHYRQEEEPGSVQPPSCTVDYLVQVTDIGARLVADRLLVNSLATGEPLEGVQASGWKLPPVAHREREEEQGGAEAEAEATPMGSGEGALPEAQAMPQGALKLPQDWEDNLVLLRRGEDYRLHSLEGTKAPWRVDSKGGAASPMVEMFSDRPLYRPGDVAHLRGVLRYPKKGGLALPRVKEVELSFRKPNGEVMETRRVPMDAFGAFTADVTLPEGEEDVTGNYVCKMTVNDGGRELVEELVIRSEVFRRDAFTVSLSTELDPVAPKGCGIRVEARDYNGSPVVGGKLSLKLFSSAPLLNEKGERPEGVEGKAGQQPLTRELELDAEGRAHWQGSFGPFEKEGQLTIRASVANDREEYVELEPLSKRLAPADFLIRVNYRGRLTLLDARSAQPLARAQELQLRITHQGTRRHELPCGLSRLEPERQEALCRRITVPANCAEGVSIMEEVGELREQLERAHELQLELSGRDEAGRAIRYEQNLYLYSWEDDEVEGELRAEGHSVTLSTRQAFEAGRLHLLIHSQGRLRHALATVDAGARSISIPLTGQEYGDVAVTAILCRRDRWGTYRHWQTVCDSCRLPRPDKQLQLQLSLPEGARPGEAVTIRGRVLNASGKPVKAALTLFAVDAGMMSVAPYTLPDLATRFYEGESITFSHSREKLAPCRPKLLAMPDVWNPFAASWDEGPKEAQQRSVYPMSLRTRALRTGLGSLCRMDMEQVVREARSGFRWSELLSFGMMSASSDMVPVAADESLEDDMVDGLGAGGGGYGAAGLTSGFRPAKAKNSFRERMLARVDALWCEELVENEAPAVFCSYVPPMENEGPPRLRNNFEPVAVWQAALESEAEGNFCTEFTLPDTLTTYKVYAVALDASGESFGKAEGEFLVNQELMLTAGTPFFMSLGDRLMLPLTITNNSDDAGEWNVTLSGAGEGAAQQVQLEGRRSATLYFEVEAKEEGTCRLQWSARSARGGDAVEGSFPVRYPAPLLKEAHRLVLAEGGEGVALAGLLAAETAGATRGDVEVAYSTSPLIHLAGSVDFLLSYPYGCTEQQASALMPWLFHEQLAPFCPQMALGGKSEVRQVVEQSIERILARQQADGGLSYWQPERGQRAESCPWASAHAALVLTIAGEQGYEVDAEALTKLRNYLGRINWRKHGYLTQYAVARARGKGGEVNRILVRALKKELEEVKEGSFRRQTADLEFMAELQSNPAGRHEALLRWLRSKGKDYRHCSSWSSGWTLIALAEYLKLEPGTGGEASLSINGETKQVQAVAGRLRFTPGEGGSLGEALPSLSPGKGTVYVSVNVKAQPGQTEYPGVTEKGLQVTRLYEVKDADGQWRAASEFKVGEVVRVTLTCAKIADELEYLVLEDYLPACLEAINPKVPGQAAGLEDGGWGQWSHWIDHREYLADRVRGFCTRWAGRDVVNMSYYARVKRAGRSMAAPAEAQLMYEPQTYGLSPNVGVESR